MPFSQSSQLATIVGFMESVRPRSILDIGVGFGQYGFLARTNLEHLNLFDVNGSNAKKRPKSEWQITIDGIEGFAPYLTPVHEYAYNEIFIGDALELVPQLDRQYDLILAIDILEHFHKEPGQDFLRQLKNIALGHILVSTPKQFIEQHEEAKPYENHRSYWIESDLISQGYSRILDNRESWIAVYTVAPEGVRSENEQG